MNRGPSIVTLAVLATIAVGCGLQADQAPRDIRPVDQPSARDITSTSGPGESQSAKIYMFGPLRDGQAPQLVPIRRQLDAVAIGDRIAALLAGPAAADQPQTRTAVATGTKLLNSEVRATGLALIDLSDQFISVPDDVLVDAAAQIVFTVSELPGVSRVQLLVNGQPFDVPRGGTTPTSGPLSTFDFPGYNPSSQPSYPVVPSATIPVTTLPTATT